MDISGWEVLRTPVPRRVWEGLKNSGIPLTSPASWFTFYLGPYCGFTQKTLGRCQERDRKCVFNYNIPCILHALSYLIPQQSSWWQLLFPSYKWGNEAQSHSMTCEGHQGSKWQGVDLNSVLFYSTFWLYCTACRILVSQPENGTHILCSEIMEF